MLSCFGRHDRLPRTVRRLFVPTPPSGRRHSRVIGAIAAIVVLSSCSPNALQALHEADEAKLSAPDSVQIQTFDHDRSTGLEGTQSAYVERVLGTSQSPDAVVAFFSSALLSRGWRSATGESFRVRASGEIAADAWRKGNMVLRLGVLRVDDAANGGVATSGYSTVYRVTLLAADQP